MLEGVAQNVQASIGRRRLVWKMATELWVSVQTGSNKVCRDIGISNLLLLEKLD